LKNPEPKTELARLIIEAAFEKAQRLGVIVTIMISAAACPARVLDPKQFHYRHPQEN
jgi:hypothetical protein